MSLFMAEPHALRPRTLFPTRWSVDDTGLEPALQGAWGWLSGLRSPRAAIAEQSPLSLPPVLSLEKGAFPARARLERWRSGPAGCGASLVFWPQRRGSPRGASSVRALFLEGRLAAGRRAGRSPDTPPGNALSCREGLGGNGPDSVTTVGRGQTPRRGAREPGRQALEPHR